jgi:PAS domain S-box-containing protein
MDLIDFRFTKYYDFSILDNKEVFSLSHANIKTKLYLQYTFLMDRSSTLYPCDDAGNDFLKSSNLDMIHSHIQGIKLTGVISNTTIIYENNSYNLRVIPLSNISKDIKEGLLDNIDFEYAITLQNQAIFADVIHSMNHVHFHKNYFETILDSYSDGIFITAADGTAIYLNSTYEDLTGMKRENIIGKKVHDLESAGYFTPLVTPTVLKTNQVVTVFQRFKTNKFAFITGTPIYNNIGEPVVVLICASAFEYPNQINRSEYSWDASPAPISMQLYEDSSIDIIAESVEMRHALQDAFRISAYDVHVLILGDSGTGKEVVSSLIHTSSKRKQQPFVKINCSNLSPTLLESELFGYEAGSFTGALSKGKPGLFEIAGRGTILLDEIGEMSTELQAKLLRVLQSGEILRVGGTKPIKINARVIASTNRDIKRMVSEGTFRKDLYYRLNVATILLPSLNERKEDIAPLLLHFLYIYNKKYGMNKKLSPDLIKTLEDYDWPGNVRELKNIVERLLIMCIDDVLEPKHLFTKYFSFETSKEEQNLVSVAGIPKLADAVGIVEKTIVSRALEATKSTRKAAELIGVSQSTIMRKIKEYDIQI